MRDRDIKLLWGRAGNRCAICKRELTLAGGKDTLGEMAHICAKSPAGPRGDRGADEVFLNSYENRILLCPTDHIEIDRDAAAWTVEHLIRTKNDHEAWVGEQLGRATIAVARADNTAFLNTRRNAWSEKAQRAVAVSVALTPLQLGEVLDPVTGDGPRLLAEARLPGDEPLNRYKTRPDQRTAS